MDSVHPAVRERIEPSAFTPLGALHLALAVLDAVEARRIMDRTPIADALEGYADCLFDVNDGSGFAKLRKLRESLPDGILAHGLHGGELRHRHLWPLLRPAPVAEGERERIKQPPEPRAPVEHELKCWPEYFRAIECGVKTFEVRRNDRGFRNGDVLWLREWESETGRYSGAEMRRKISYMTGFEQRDGYVVMALAALRAPTEREPAPAASDAGCNPPTFDEPWWHCYGPGPTPEAKAELRDYAEWLKLPKPKPEFKTWRAERRVEPQQAEAEGSEG